MNALVRTLAYVLLLCCVAGCSEGSADRSASRLTGVSPWPEQPAACPSEAASAELRREARDLWERARFDARDAPRAVIRLEAALACARRSGDLLADDALQALRADWRAEVERRLSLARLRLDLALRSDDAEAVSSWSRTVDGLLGQASSARAAEARAWLDRIRRRARAMQAGEGLTGGER